MPLIEVSLRDESASALEYWYIEPLKRMIKGEQVLPVTADYTIDPSAKPADVKVRFVLKAKNVSEDGDNTQAPHADGSAHPNADAKDQESPQHGGAPQHRESSH